MSEQDWIIDPPCRCGHEAWEHHTSSPRGCFARVRHPDLNGPHDHVECYCQEYTHA